MKRGIFLQLLIIGLILTSGFISGQSTKETRDLKDFTKIGFGVAGNMSINFGPEFKVVLEGDKALLDKIITEVSGGKLVIKKERDSWFSGMNEKISVYITMPELKGLGVSGSGKAEVKDALKTTDLDLNVSGSGKIYTTDLVVTSLNCGISGSGDIVIGGNGNAKKADLSISGSGNLSGENLKAESAEVHISGSGNCNCNVTETLQASISGSGNITYLGNPKIDARVSGSGHVRSK
jgi:Putative auto-transporter adhesin, head GIN domain